MFPRLGAQRYYSKGEKYNIFMVLKSEDEAKSPRTEDDERSWAAGDWKEG